MRARGGAYRLSIPNAAYATDDQTAITVVDGEVRVVSEGHWTQLRTLAADAEHA